MPHDDGMLRIEKLTKRYGSITVVDAMTFELEPGTVTAMIGSNGSGKSSTFNMICGLTKPCAGFAHINNVSYRRLPNPGRVVGAQLGLETFHPRRSGSASLGIIARSLGLPADAAHNTLDRVGLSGADGRRRIGEYSMGMKQRLGIGAALLGDPDLLILDEPLVGLDPAGIAWIRRLLRAFSGSGGTALFSSHFLGEVSAVAHRVLVVHNGRLIDDLDPAADVINAASLEQRFIDHDLTGDRT